MKTLIASTLLVAALAASPLISQADDVPPRGALSMLEVVKDLEKSGYQPIVDISFDDGNWEVEAFKDASAVELLVDPASGRVISEHADDAEPQPPTGAKLLSEIVAALIDAGYTDVSDASFEGRTWEAEARREGVKRELRVNPVSGEVISDRSDD